MKKKLFLGLAIGILGSFLTGVGSLASPPSPAPQPKQSNVILVTFDGIRWREVFLGLDPKLSGGQVGKLFVNLLTDLRPQGVLFGNFWAGNSIRVSTTMVTSLPIYQSILSGYAQPCSTNECGRITVETLPERLIRDLSLQPKEVAVIASWDAIALAAEHVQGAVFTNTGMDPLSDGKEDAELAEINRLQKEDAPPWGGGGVRYDKYTYAHALRYLKVHQPRFLFISFNDTDEYGHRGNYGGYSSIIRLYDLWLKELVETLDGMGEYGKSTTLLVSTDHGRGTGVENWKHHATSVQESELSWLYGRSPHTRSKERRRAPRSINTKTQLPPKTILYEHRDFRPTIEALFGLKPQDCKKCGREIREITGNLVEN